MPCPSPTKFVNAVQWPKEWPIANAIGDFADTCAKVSLIQDVNSFNTGADRVWRIRLFA